MKDDQNGYIVVETVGTFIPFVLVIVSVLSLVNIITVQARIHNALTQTALTLSMYCYVLEVIGISDDLGTLDEKANAFSASISSVQEGINSLTGDTEGFAQGLLNFGINELRSNLSATLIHPLIMSYMDNGDISGDEYLKSVRVVDFYLSDCIIIDRNNNIKLTASYEVEYTFGALRLPFTPTLRIEQTAVTKAWLGGSGEGYRK